MKLKIYGAIGNAWWASVVPADVVEQIEQVADGEEIELHVHSEGGDAMGAVAIHNALRAHQGPVTVHVDGMAASAASVIMMAGDRVVMPANAVIMIHNPWTVAVGDSREMRKKADTLDVVREALVASYKRKTGRSEAELRALLDEETWMGAEEAKRQGFADEVTDAVDDEEMVAMAAAVDLTGFKEAPPAWHQARKKVVAMVAMANYKRKGVSHMKPEQNKGPVQAQASETPRTQAESNEAPQSQVDTSAVREEAIKAERQRIATITNAAKNLGFSPEQYEDVVAKGLSVEASLIELSNLKASAQQSQGFVRTSGAGNRISQGEQATDKVAEGIKSSLLERSGMAKNADTKNQFRGRSMVEMGRAFLNAHGVAAEQMDQDEIVNALFSFSPQASWSGGGRLGRGDFSSLMLDVANNAMMFSFDEQPVTYPIWTQPDQLRDFRPSYRTRLNQFPTLRRVPEHADLEYVKMADRHETMMLATYAEGFALTRQVIVNDEVNALTEVPTAMGEAAARTIQWLVSQLLNLGNTSNGQQMTYDGNPIFDSSHGNLIDDPLSTDALAAARLAMRTQRDEGGKGLLNTAPRYLIVGAENETLAEEIVLSPFKSDGTTSRVHNAFSNLEIIVDANLGDSTGIPELDGSATAWYLSAARSNVHVAGLNGPPVPTIAMDGPAGFFGQKMMVGLDVAVRCITPEGLLKSTGDGT